MSGKLLDNSAATNDEWPGIEIPPEIGEIHLRGFRGSITKSNLRRQVFPFQAGFQPPAIIDLE